jgi:hypothetical protein
VARGHVERQLNPAESANRGYSLAEDIVNAILDYCSSPVSQEDTGRDFTSLAERATALRGELHRVGPLRTPPNGTPNADLLKVLRDVEALSVDALVRTHGLGIQADQQSLRHAIAAAGSASI